MKKKNNKQAKDYIDERKRKKRNKKYMMTTVVIVISSFIFLTKAPIFNIKSIEVLGTSTLSSKALVKDLNIVLGKNLFLQNKNEIADILMENEYIKEIEISKKGINKISVEVKEEAPVYYINDDNVIKLINEDLKVIEVIDDIAERNLVEIKGLEYSDSEVGNVLSENQSYKIILKEFYPYIAQNREEIKLSWLNISEIIDIHGKIGDIDIDFGHYSDMNNKMETIYDIILSKELNMKTGYIDVSFDGPPVINNTTK